MLNKPFIPVLTMILASSVCGDQPLVNLETYDVTRIVAVDFGPPLWVTPRPIQSDRVKVVKEKTAQGWVLDVTIRDTSLRNPGILLPPPEGKLYWDLSGFSHLYADIENLDHDQQMMVSLRITNPLVGTYQIANNSGFGLNPDEKRTLKLYYPQADEFAPCRIDDIRATPPGIPGKKNVDGRRVDAIIFWGHSLRDFSRNNSVHYRIANIRLAQPYRGPGAPVNTPEKFFPFVDRYGQYIHQEWPEKIHADADLAEKREKEKRLTQPRIASWNRWGGWSDGPQLKSTGFFRTEKYEGKWYLVDPDGKLFFSHGVNAIKFGMVGPARHPQWYAADVNRRARGILDCFNDNLIRKYGPDLKKHYPEVVDTRLAAWGLNTIGCWSAPECNRNHKTPYMMDFGIGRAKRTTAPVEGLPRGMWDPFDPRFAAALAERPKDPEVAAAQNDPWCIGFFLLNEVAWGDRTAVARSVLASSPQVPAKQALVKELKERYCVIEGLNREWGTSYAGWEALLNARRLPNTRKAFTDLLLFNARYIDLFYSICRDAVKKYSPHHLYFGSRFNLSQQPELYVAASRYCDVVACNVYSWSMDGFRREGLDTDKPILISEFHVGVLDQGQFNADSRPAGITQADRAHAYLRLMQGALLHPQIVGMHHFDWADQPLTGRGDGENFAIGLVDVADTPYWEFVDMMRQVGEHMMAYRLKGQFACDWEKNP